MPSDSARPSSRRVLGTASAVVLAVSTLAAGMALPADAAGPYRARHYDLRSLPLHKRSNSGWYRLRLPPKPPIDAHGIPLTRDGGTLSYPVGELSINGMRRLTRWLVRCEERQLDQALKQARKLRKLAIRQGRTWWIPHGFDNARLDLQAPWYDAMVQGLALSFFIRLHETTGARIHLRAARHVFRSFLVLGPGPRRWVARVDRAGHLWLEHHPPRLTRVLNAHLHTLFGLHEFWQATRSRKARRLVEGAITTMDDQLWRYRSPGGASLYSLSSGARKRGYHHIHVWQIRLLAAISGERSFARMAGRFARDLPGRPSMRGAPGHPAAPRSLPCRAGAALRHHDRTR
jgi:D-glucuronyl C5-epimerase C-terminus